MFARTHHYENADYLAGHWKTGLVRSLLWYRPEAYTPLERYRAPSWSWAAGEGKVQGVFQLIRDRSYPVNVIETSVVANGCFGEVESGHLVLSAGVYPLHLSYEANTSSGPRQTDRIISANVSGSLYSGNQRKESYLQAPTFYPDDSEVCNKLDHAQIYLPLMASSILLTITDIWGLVLAPTGNEHGEYKRVGVLKLNAFTVTRNGYKKLVPDVSEHLVHRAFPWLEKPQSLSKEFYQSRDLDGRHRVKII